MLELSIKKFYSHKAWPGFEHSANVLLYGFSVTYMYHKNKKKLQKDAFFC